MDRFIIDGFLNEWVMGQDVDGWMDGWTDEMACSDCGSLNTTGGWRDG